MRIGRLIAVLSAAVVLIASCGSSEETPSATSEPTTAETTTAQAATTTAEAAPEPPAEVPEQLDFTAMTIDGEEFSGSTLAGKPAVMWFWAPWCPKCKREAPTVAQAAADNPDVTFVGVAARDELPAMEEFVQTYNIGDFTNLADTDGAVWQKFGVTNQPAFAFVGADGTVDVVTSSLGADALKTKIDALAGA